jgi:hypothetical protein
MIRSLIETAKVNMSLVNNQGYGVLHLAAQGNKALSVYYFAVKQGLNINQVD